MSISKGDDLPNPEKLVLYRTRPELISLLHDLSSARAMMDNSLFRDFKKNQVAFIEAGRQLAEYYDREIYDGPE